MSDMEEVKAELKTFVTMNFPEYLEFTSKIDDLIENPHEYGNYQERCVILKKLQNQRKAFEKKHLAQFFRDKGFKQPFDILNSLFH